VTFAPVAAAHLLASLSFLNVVDFRAAATGEVFLLMEAEPLNLWVEPGLRERVG
jgi:hypothetical protein